VKLTKHHGLGNDFLVYLDLDGVRPLTAELAVALCDRHTGVGADGLIRAGAGAAGAAVTMELRNADGGRAEMSGNGIRCLAQAVVDAGVAPAGELAVLTDAGVRVLTVEPEVEAGLRQVSVDMGPVRARPAATVPGAPGRTEGADLGNPHVVVLVDDPRSVDFSSAAPDVNVEALATGPGPDAITMRVWERGVGETRACGTGACAAAWVAHGWGLVGPVVTVHQPGGDALVTLEDDTVILAGPTRLVAHVEVPDTPRDRRS
jgi:diaminopimelate epimerase